MPGSQPPQGQRGPPVASPGARLECLRLFCSRPEDGPQTSGVVTALSCAPHGPLQLVWLWEKATLASNESRSKDGRETGHAGSESQPDAGVGGGGRD